MMVMAFSITHTNPFLIEYQTILFHPICQETIRNPLISSTLIFSLALIASDIIRSHAEREGRERNRLLKSEREAVMRHYHELKDRMTSSRNGQVRVFMREWQ
jgi:hypothetical protein